MSCGTTKGRIIRFKAAMVGSFNSEHLHSPQRDAFPCSAEKEEKQKCFSMIALYSTFVCVSVYLCLFV